MTIIKKLNLDFVQRNHQQKVDAVQGDSYTRVLELSMYEKGTAWDMPPGGSAFLRYQKPDGTGGVYDTLPDGTQAWSARNHVVNFTLAPQVLSTPGIVQAQLEIVRGTARLASFTFLIEVATDPSVGVLDSDDYVSWNAWALQSLENLFFVGGESPGVKPALWFDTSQEYPRTQITVIDKDGNTHLPYPVTQMACVEGLEDALAGKAPSGYGLGVGGTVIGDCNDAVNSGFYRWDTLCENSPFDYATMIVAGRTKDTNCSQIAICAAGTRADEIAVRSGNKTTGTFQPWEWINPAMTLGVEYRTAERWKGKPVYRKLMSWTHTDTVGNAAGVAEIKIDHGISGLTQIVRCDATVGVYTMPYISSGGGITAVCAVNTTQITVRAVNTEWTGREWIFDLAYIKG